MEGEESLEYFVTMVFDKKLDEEELLKSEENEMADQAGEMNSVHIKKRAYRSASTTCSLADSTNMLLEASEIKLALTQLKEELLMKPTLREFLHLSDT
jgi:hypothetical protein